MTALFAVAVVLAAVAAARGLWSPCGLSMISALNPLAERGRGHRWPATVAWHIAGAACGGAALGAGCAAAAYGYGRLGAGAAVTWTIAAVSGAVTLLADRGAGRVRLPIHPRQVDQRWLTSYRRWVYAAGYGAQIGTGFATYIMTSATYLVAVLAALTGRPLDALVVGVAFGTVRGATVLLAAGATTPERLRSRVAMVERWSGGSRLVAGLAQAAVVLVAATLAAGPLGAVAAAAALGGVTAAHARNPAAPPAVAS